MEKLKKSSTWLFILYLFAIVLAVSPSEWSWFVRIIVSIYFTAIGVLVFYKNN